MKKELKSKKNFNEKQYRKHQHLIIIFVLAIYLIFLLNGIQRITIINVSLVNVGITQI